MHASLLEYRCRVEPLRRPLCSLPYVLKVCGHKPCEIAARYWVEVDEDVNEHACLKQASCSFYNFPYIPSQWNQIADKGKRFSDEKQRRI